MKRLFFLVLLIGFAIAGSQVFYSCSSTKKAGTVSKAKVADQINSLTAQEKTEGWELMFDGKTTKGWRKYDTTVFPAAGWAVDNGTLRCIGSGMGEAGGKGGDILYDKKFKDFDLKLEWKISTGGNSGIFYFVQEITHLAQRWLYTICPYGRAGCCNLNRL